MSKAYYVKEIDPLDNGAYQYGVFEYECPKDKPSVQLSRPVMIATFSHEWRAIRFMNERRSETE